MLVTTPNLHLRGMDRNRVIVDGTASGAAPCSSDPALQDFRPNGSGRNGIEALKTDGVSVENLTVCNFLTDSTGNNGNQIWFNGGDGSGTVGLPSLSTSGETLTIEELLTLRARTENAGHVGHEHEWSLACG